ncbi:MAG: isoprenyl transferase [Nitrospinota bacterium]
MARKDASSKIDPTRLPRHIAIIMDGNGRWAKKRLLPRIAGHREGVKAVDRVVSHCRKLGIEALTLYSFSAENWSRPREEVSALWDILVEYLGRELDRMLREDIRFNTIGHIHELPKFAQRIVADSQEKTKNRRGMTLTLALSYGARQEILDATKAIASRAKEGLLEPSEIDAALFESYLTTAPLPEVDLLIRTSGELRISNFLLWQLAYTELYFTDTLWPDFDEKELERAILEFQKRQRRFGLTAEQVAPRRG